MKLKISEELQENR